MVERTPRKKTPKTLTFSTPPDVAAALENARALGFNRSRLICDAIRHDLTKRGFLKKTR